MRRVDLRRRPGPCTARLLDILDAHHVKATFFEIGTSIPVYPDVVQRQVADA